MRKTLGLLLAAAAAVGIYKYSKMTPQQKKDLKEKGKDFLDKKMRMGDLLTRKSAAQQRLSNKRPVTKEKELFSNSFLYFKRV